MTADLTQQELADALKVSMRTVGNWERSAGRLPRARERHIIDVLGAVGETDDPFDGVSNMALLVELGKRLDRVTRERGESDDEPARRRHGAVLGTAGATGLDLQPEPEPDPQSAPDQQSPGPSQ